MGTVRDEPAVLVVEGDLDRLDRYAAWVPEEYAVDRASDGAAALAAAADADVVVLGGDLPDRSTGDVLGRLRARGYEGQVVRVTDGDPDFDIVGSRADDVLVGPVEAATFRDCLSRVGDRLSYDEHVREYFSLVSKRAVLEARKSPEELAASDEYDRLRERTERLRRRVDDMLSDLSEDGYERVFEGFFPGTPATGTQ